MAKKLYVEVGGKTRKAKKGYVSVDGKARKIKKAYVGVDGKARAFWSGGELRYYGTATALSVGRVNIQGVSTSHHALFGGGYNGASKTIVDAYNASLTRTTPSALQCGGGSGVIGAPAGQYAIFTISDITPYGNTPTLNADAYDLSLTRSTIAVAKYAHFFMSIPASTQSAAIFSGGCFYENNALLGPSGSECYAVTSGLTIQKINNMSSGESPTACSFGTNALYAGGSTYETSENKSKKIASNTVDAYDTSLTRTNPTALSATGFFYGASLGNYALFASKSNDVNLYDQSLTRTTLRKLSVERTGVASATIGNYALYAGGKISNDNYSNAVDVYTID